MVYFFIRKFSIIKDEPLLAFITLYRRILRANRKYLPPDVCFFGNKYVQQEFRLHKDVKNPLHLVGFMNSWQNYLKDIENCSWKTYKFDPIKGKRLNLLYILYNIIAEKNVK